MFDTPFFRALHDAQDKITSPAGQGISQLVPLILIVVIGAAIAALLLRLRGRAARARMLEDWAGAKGFSFDPEEAESFEETFAPSSFPALSNGSDRTASNIVRGKWGERKMIAFDYEFTTGFGKSRKIHEISAVAIEAPYLLHDLLIRDETLGDRISAFVGGDDINFESAEFSRRFYVQASDRKWAYDVLHARAIEFLLAQPDDFAIQFNLGWTLAWRDAQFQFTDDFEGAAKTLAGLLDLLPDYLGPRAAALEGAPAAERRC